MEREKFEQLVTEGFRQLPERFRELVRNVAFVVEGEPSEEERHGQGLEDDETLLGLYVGIPHTARGAGYGVGGTMPDVIKIYQDPIEEAAEYELEFALEHEGVKLYGTDYEARLAAKVREIVADTVWHEVAHHFGFDEYAVRERESRRLRA